jgi:hypothetical protein
LKVGLVDALGGMEEAKILLQKLAGQSFHLPHPERLILEEYEAPFPFWDLLSRTSLPAIKALLFSPLAGRLLPPETGMLPLSMRYPNQPLWVMEGAW